MSYEGIIQNKCHDEHGGTTFIGDFGKTGVYSGTGTMDYRQLFNKPSINSVELNGNNTSTDLGLQGKMNAITNQTIDKIIFGEE